MSQRRLNPVFSLWLKPRATMRQLLESGFDRWNYTLAAARGLGLAALIPSDSLVSDGTPDLALITALLLMGVLVGVILLPLRAWAITSTSRHLKGSANYREIRGAIAWSGVIGCWEALIWIGLVGAMVALHLFDPRLYDSLNEVYGDLAWSVIDLAIVLIFVWHTVVELKCVAEASRFSVWKAWIAEIFAQGLLAVVLIFPAFLLLGAWAALTTGN